MMVIVPALNGSVLEWLHIVRELEHDTRVCVCDRAGIGWSDPPPRGRLSIAAMAADLHALLRAATVPRRTSWAGIPSVVWVACRFAADHPEQVCGLLVDSSHEDQASRIPLAAGRRGDPGVRTALAAPRARCPAARRHPRPDARTRGGPGP